MLVGTMQTTFSCSWGKIIKKTVPQGFFEVFTVLLAKRLLSVIVVLHRGFPYFLWDIEKLCSEGPNIQSFRRLRLV